MTKEVGMSEAIKLAIEKGGYGLDKPREVSEAFLQSQYKNWEAVVLDPLFWQALGKALGWEHPTVARSKDGFVMYSGWLKYWHRFIDWLAEEKNPDDFFINLMKGK